jgi:hypothetical protein
MTSIKDSALLTTLAVAMMLGTAFTAPAQTPTPTPAPAPPATDIFVIDLGTGTGGKLKLGQPVKISTWAGYNNQPSFLPDGRGILSPRSETSRRTSIAMICVRRLQLRLPTRRKASTLPR